MVVLPSESLLRKYKNSLVQEPGLHDDNLLWMYNSAKEMGCVTSGGLTIDEMAVQEEIVLDIRKENMQLTGLVQMGNTAASMKKLNTHKEEVTMATHILQCMFVSFDGFRWPVAYYPSSGASGPELFEVFWDVVDQLKLRGFKVEYICMDGASTNRSFMKTHVPPDHSSFTTTSIYDDDDLITFLMDFSHVVKRIRNNISSSGDKDMHIRKLTLADGSIIIWDFGL